MTTRIWLTSIHVTTTAHTVITGGAAPTMIRKHFSITTQNRVRTQFQPYFHRRFHLLGYGFCHSGLHHLPHMDKDARLARFCSRLIRRRLTR